MFARLVLAGESPKDLCEVEGIFQQLFFLPDLMTVQGVGSSGKSLKDGSEVAHLCALLEFFCSKVNFRQVLSLLLMSGWLGWFFFFL